jgi:hypothetical protein
MTSSTTRSFRDRFQRLPPHVGKLAVHNYRLWRNDPSHPSLHFKRVGEAFWSVRIGLQYRALARKTPSGFQWFWIGSHDEYERVIGGR